MTRTEDETPPEKMPPLKLLHRLGDQILDIRRDVALHDRRLSILEGNPLPIDRRRRTVKDELLFWGVMFSCGVGLVVLALWVAQKWGTEWFALSPPSR